MNQRLKGYMKAIIIGSAIFTLMTACESPKHTTIVSGETFEGESQGAPDSTDLASNNLPLSDDKIDQSSLDLTSPQSTSSTSDKSTGDIRGDVTPEAPPQPSGNQQEDTRFFDGGPKPEEASSQLTFSDSTPSVPTSPSVQPEASPREPNVPSSQFLPESPAQPSESQVAQEERSDSQYFDVTRDRGRSSFLQEQPPTPKELMPVDPFTPLDESPQDIAKKSPKQPDSPPGTDQPMTHQPETDQSGTHQPMTHQPETDQSGTSAPGLAPVYFDYDQYTLKPEATAVLEANAQLLKTKYQNVLVLIEGHCDERGTQEYNMVLGKRRALSAKKYLVDLGVSASQLTIVSYGEDRPFCKEHQPSCWQQNRRAHFVLR